MKAPPRPATRAACAGGHVDPPPAAVRLTYRGPEGTPLAVELLCQPCADAVSLPWVRVQRTALIHRAG